METLGFTVLVAKVKDKASPLAGQMSPPLFGAVTIGRSRSCGMVLGDRSISGRHVHLERLEDEFVLTNLSRHGATYVDRRKLSTEERFSITKDTFWLQLGHLLLRITAIPDTLPVSECLSIPGTELPLRFEPPHTPLIAVRAGPRLEVWLGGQPVSLYPSALRLLLCLCQTPGKVVTYDELSRAVDPTDHLNAGGTNITQLVTYTRNMFAEALDENLIAQSTLAASFSGVGDLPTDTRSLLRKLVENIRGLGYRLNLAPEAIQILDAQAPPPRIFDES